MFVSYGKFWKNYVNFSDETSRRDFWRTVLADFIIQFLMFAIFVVVDMAFFGNTLLSALSNPSSTVDFSAMTITELVYWIVSTLYSLAKFIPSLSISVRRLHNIGKSGLNLFWIFLPIVGWIILLVFFCKRSVYED